MNAPPSDPPSAADGPARGDLATYFAEARARVPGFVAGHLTWPGTLRLHAVAFGWDLLRAPCNILLSPVLVLTRIAALLCRLLRLGRLGKWLGRRRILLRTSVARQVECVILTDLLAVPLCANAARDPAALVRAIGAAPHPAGVMRKERGDTAADALAERLAHAIGEYTSTRIAVAEITTALVVISIGILAFQAPTPGIISLAPGVADAVARVAAIEGFPLGDTLGGLWYGVFNPRTSGWLVAATLAGLLAIGSVFTAFAGVLADPVQSRLGIHRRRLARLIDTLEAECEGFDGKPFVPREHFYARALDLWDIVMTALRIFRS